MHIGLNVMAFRAGRIGGVETYFRNLLERLQQLDFENQYSILGDSHELREFILINSNFQGRICAYRKSPVKKFCRNILKKTFNIDILEVNSICSKIDLIHHPFSTINKEWEKIPSVLTFWDMQHEFYPDFFTLEELHNRRETYRLSTNTATRIIVGSEFTRQSLVEKYKVSPCKIDVVYPGYGVEHRVCNDQDLLEIRRTKYGLNKPFMFYPAATWPHKNHKTLLTAMRLMKDRYGFDGELVLTGASMNAQREILEQIDKLGLVNAVKTLGYLSFEDLPFVYNLARVMVFPSLFEGFGIPLVEAMACGCPVVCSNVTSIPEVVEDAALMFDPNSPEDLAEKIWSVWTDETELSHMKLKGLERAKMFNWGETAQKTLETYSKASKAIA